MIYVFKCPGCGDEAEFKAPVAMLETLREGAHCISCECPARQVVTGGRTPIVRSPFPKGFHEHISADGAFVRDKHEAKDIAAENGLISRYVENNC